MRKLVLASQSPRRQELLKLLGHPFSVIPAHVEENYLSGELPSGHVKRLAEAKAGKIAGEVPKSIVIGSDTIVVIDGDILGKPGSRAEAFDMVMRLQGRTHEVYTGFALIDTESGRMISDFEMTEVTMTPLIPSLVDLYLDTGESFDKAGAYGIQGYGSALIVSVKGCYFNVMGLPLAKLMKTLNSFSNGYFGYFGSGGDKLQCNCMKN